MAELVSLPTCPLEPTLFEFSQIQQGNSKNIWIRSIASYLAVLVALVLLKKGIRYVVRKHRYAWWISSDVKEIVWISGGEVRIFQAEASLDSRNLPFRLASRSRQPQSSTSWEIGRQSEHSNRYFQQSFEGFEASWYVRSFKLSLTFEHLILSLAPRSQIVVSPTRFLT